MISAGWGTVAAQNQDDGEWIDLFNGKNLDNWVIKFTGYPLGENFNNTFRVEDGLLTVSYDEWDQWDGQFGHIFYDRSFSHYILRVEYRIVGEQVEGGPGWAFRNNGLMLHSQDPETMTLDQEFPVSLETQLLGGNGTDERSTLNT
jgi:AAA+ superfamily predicted ATPase